MKKQSFAKDRLGLKVDKEKDGSYKTQPEQLRSHLLRFANNYAYVTINDSANID